MIGHVAPHTFSAGHTRPGLGENRAMKLLRTGLICDKDWLTRHSCFRHAARASRPLQGEPSPAENR